MYDNSLALMAAMREEGIEFRSDTPESDDNVFDVVRVSWRGRSLPMTEVEIRLTERGAALRAGLGAVDPARRDEALRECNAVNASYRWMRLAVDGAGELQALSDVFLVPEVAGLFGITAVGMLFDSLDELHPRLAPLFLSAGAR